MEPLLHDFIFCDLANYSEGVSWCEYEDSRETFQSRVLLLFCARACLPYSLVGAELVWLSATDGLL